MREPRCPVRRVGLEPRDVGGACSSAALPDLPGMPQLVADETRDVRPFLYVEMDHVVRAERRPICDQLYRLRRGVWRFVLLQPALSPEIWNDAA